MNIPTDDIKIEKKGRPALPFGLSLLLIFSFVFNGLLLILLLLGLFYPGIVQKTLLQYYPQIHISITTAFMVNFTGVLLFGISFRGLTLLWRMKKRGFYYYASAQVVMLIVLVFIFRSYDIINIAIAIVFIIIIGLYVKKMD
nr:hypothetical protein [Bacteroidota bacterium]